MTWLYLDKEFNNHDDYYGYVYCIENLITGKKYIGRKYFHKFSKKKLIGESDWRDYYGSCKPLLEDVDRLGKHCFKRTILHLCETRQETNYKEVVEQIIRDVLWATNENGDRLYYNGNILSRFFGLQEGKPKPASFREKLKGNKNAAGNKGNKQSEEHKKKRAIAMTGKTRTPDHCSNISKSKKGLIPITDGNTTKMILPDASIPEGWSHGRTNKAPKPKMMWITNGTENKLIRNEDGVPDGWYKGRPGAGKNKRKAKSKKMMWITDGNENKRVIFTCDIPIGWQKGRTSQKIIECPYCKVKGAGSNMNRYHFAKCQKYPLDHK
jgi:hypothetical protein